jgi:uncharacterized membrane protein
MKRVTGAVLLGLGLFLLVLAPLLWLYVAPNMAKVPLNQRSVTVSEADGATYLSITKEDGVQIKKDQDIRATRTVHGDVKNGSDDRVVFDVSVVIENRDDDSLIRANLDRLALDRRTSEAIKCCREGVDSEPVEHKGISYKFPFGTEKKTYAYFDIIAKNAFPMEFKGEEKVKGLDTYRFEQVIEGEEVDERDAPASLFGRTEPGNIKADLIYNNVRTVWVEPVSGSIVRGQEDQKQVLRADGDEVVVFEALLAFNDKTVTEQVDKAEEAKSGIRTITVLLPLALLVLGVLLVIVGLLLARRPSQHGSRRAEDRSKTPLNA